MLNKNDWEAGSDSEKCFSEMQAVRFIFSTGCDISKCYSLSAYIWKLTVNLNIMCSLES